ncbi:hypothetical protein COF34_23575 [Bacillus toyonensis]|uniref:glycosyltransferase family 39 protein n=1 Tax=Bacillus toyonensis TaxID=155322 RepID=UPI000BFB57EB|nr:glycosyltransferase family 39 protein [Bacillus toyonensis]PHC54239.1 hypothetical protein COF34_23575 [Bacillus toyonensis]
MQIKENLGRNIFSKILVVCGLAMFVITLYNSFQIEKSTYSSVAVLILEIVATILVLGIISFLANRFLTVNQFLLILIVTAFAIRLLWIIFEKTVPISDFSVMYESAQQAVKGNFAFITDEYYMSWTYQLGFTYYEAILIKIFGNHLFILKLFNIFWSVGTAVIIYFMGKTIFNEYSARTAAIFYALYMPNIIYSSVLTNQYISTFFFFLGLYVLITKGFSTKYGWGLTGLLLSIGNIMRPLGSFFLLAVFVYVLIYKILPFRKKETLNYVKKLVGIVIVYFLVMQIVSIFLMNTGLAKKPLSNQMPYWKFVVGFNYDSIGGWNQPDVVYLSQFKLGKERNDASIALIKDRLKDKEKVRQLLVLKVEKMWSNPDDAPGWALEWGELNKPHLQQMLTKYERLMYITCCIFAIGTISLYRRNDSIYPFLYILFGGYVVIHLFVEVQTRYRFDILPVIFLFVGYGVFVMKNGVTRLMGRKQQKKVE